MLKENLRTVLVDNDDKAPGKKYADEFYKISIVEKKKKKKFVILLEI